jgi:23S rRNA U2552 (ribose-2'-O)-methylase RlmE/FtsJ
MNNPFIFKVKSGKDEFLSNKENENIIFSSSILKPLFSLGFHHFIHRTKNAMSITNKLKSKNKFYYVVNPYEHIISDYDNDLNNFSKKYFGTKDPKILSRAFYKLWEIFFIFDIADNNKMVIASLAEGPGAFIQAAIQYRKAIGIEIKKDRLFGVTIHPEQGNYIEMGKQFMSYYDKEYPKMLKIHKTYPYEKSLKYTNRDNGDITDIKTISNFKKTVQKTKKFADLVTADGGFEWNDENYQEQEAIQLIFGEIVACLKVQAKKGCFVLKLFETFTMVSLKMIYLLSSFYDECYVYKPYFSRESNSEKYIICKGFKYDQDKKLNSKLEILENILKKMNTDKYIIDIFPELQLPQSFINNFKYINIKIANNQQIMINKIVTFIKNKNYFGEEYHNYRSEQIEATKKWISNFFPDKKKIKSSKNNLSNIIKNRILYNTKESELFNKELL